MELNKVMIIGNLTRDPETRVLPNGGQVVKMGIASNRRMGSGENRRDEVLYVDVEAWDKTAELCAQYLRKGSQILVDGRLKLDTYQTQTGEKRNKLYILAERVQFGSRPQGEGQGGAPGEYSQQRPASNYQKPAANNNDQYQDDSSSYSNNEGTEDDLPF
ncbi:MAG: single-stranded DNA-binding protein [Sumerlaeia bacterium]